MLFRRAVLEGIAAGRITLAFRRATRPPARPGGTLLTPVGQLAFDAVATVDPASLTARDAQQAGFPDLAALRAALARGEGAVHRVVLRLAGPDPRIALRAQAGLSAAEADALRQRLGRIDRASPQGAWTRRAIEAIAAAPGRRAGDLAAGLGFETAVFKTRVRQLKALGLTESLETGYRLSPRGQALLTLLRQAPIETATVPG
ncbi:hypothetical protein [Roseomonas fluvialis]|uniref:ASCH domain-containing protein n=1 Tax=Roseomonas fluvialis TaxID=1750527 RepID=A0ABN6NX25_9PROT|nr:hypothetical protein [Roseomonas fluvialis]BDG70978.1 hypothetical protein Rmf_09070 [Roseomonas fluvialis]